MRLALHFTVSAFIVSLATSFTGAAISAGGHGNDPAPWYLIAGLIMAGVCLAVGVVLMVAALIMEHRQ